MEHDLFAMCIGVLVCWLIGQAIAYVSRDFNHNNRAWVSLYTVVSKWSWIGCKLIIVSVLGLTLPPLLVGLLNEAIFLNPLAVSLTETPCYPFFRCWAIGLIYLKGWIK